MNIEGKFNTKNGPKIPNKDTTPKDKKTIKKNSNEKNDLRFSSQSKKSSNSPESDSSSNIPEKVIFPWSKIRQNFKYSRSLGIPEQLKNIITHEEIQKVLKDLKKHPLYHMRDEYTNLYGMACLLIFLFFIISLMSYVIYGAISIEETSSKGLKITLSFIVMFINIGGFIFLANRAKVQKLKKLREREEQFQKLLDFYNKKEKWVENRGMRWTCGKEGAWIELEISKETRDEANVKNIKGVQIKNSDIWMNTAFQPTFEKEIKEEFGMSDLKKEAEKKSSSSGNNKSDEKKRRKRMSSGYERDDAEEEQSLNKSASSSGNNLQSKENSYGEITEKKIEKEVNLDITTFNVNVRKKEELDVENTGGITLFSKKKSEGRDISFGDRFSEIDRIMGEKLKDKKLERFDIDED